MLEVWAAEGVVVVAGTIGVEGVVCVLLLVDAKVLLGRTSQMLSAGGAGPACIASSAWPAGEGLWMASWAAWALVRSARDRRGTGRLGAAPGREMLEPWVAEGVVGVAGMTVVEGVVHALLWVDEETLMAWA